MPNGELPLVLRRLRQIIHGREAEEPTDGQLLERFVARREEAAFEALVRRHGPMVLGVCRRVLQDSHSAEDAFQATFLVLVCKAGSLAQPELVGNWLYGVAYRVAREAKIRAARRRAHERQAPSMPQPDVTAEAAWRELRSVLDEELSRLPEKYRAAFVLCHLEGKTHAQAARALGCSTGSMSWRLGRARDLLREGLTRRGVALSAGLLATLLAQNAVAAVVPASLVGAAVQAALPGAGQAVASEVAELTHAVLKAMSATKFKATLAVVLLLGLAGTGAGFVTYQALAGRQPPAKLLQPAQRADKGSDVGKPTTDEQPHTDRYDDPLPPGALARMGTVRWRHAPYISGLVFSRDGQTVASSGAEGTIRLWEARTGRQRLRIDSGDGAVCGLALSPDGKVLASASNSVGADPSLNRGRVMFWDFPTGRRLLKIEKAGLMFLDVAFSPDGKALAAGGEDGCIYLWDAATGEQRRRIRAHQRTFTSFVWVVFSPDGRVLASTDRDAAIRLWDPATGREVHKVYVGWHRSFSRPAFSPDGKTLAAAACLSDPAAMSEQRVVLWDAATGKERLHLKGQDYAGMAVAFSPDGKTLASADAGGTVVLWDPVKGTERLRLRMPGGVGHLAFSADGRTLAGSYGMAHLWDVASGRELATTAAAHKGAVTQVLFAPGGRTLVTASDDGTVRLWDPATGRQRRALQGHGEWVRAIALSGDGRTLASLGLGDRVRLWDLASGKPLRRWRGHGGGGGDRSLAFALDGKTLASWGDDDWKLCVREVATGKEFINRQPHLSGLTDIPAGGIEHDRERERRAFRYHAAFTPDGNGLVVVSDALGHIVDVATGAERFTMPGWSRVEALALSPDGRILAVAAEEKAVRLVELVSGKEVLRIEWPGTVNAVAFSPDGTRVAAAAGEVVWARGLGIVNPRASRRIGVWDARTGQRLVELRGPSPARCLAFSPNGKTLAAGLSDTTALVWDVAAATAVEGRSAKELRAKELETLWTDLAGKDAAKAYAAVWRLVAAPKQAGAFLQARLRPASEEEQKRIQQLIVDLDHAKFTAREAASRQLEALGPEARPALDRALAAKPQPEVRKRIESLLARPPGTIRSAETLRGLRAVQVLEHVGTPGARRVLQALARGAPDALLTQEAKGSLERRARPAARP